MARDFAKSKQGGKKRAPARRKPASGGGKSTAPRRAGGLKTFAGGVLTGIFLSFLLYLGTLPTPGDRETTQAGNSQAEVEPPKPRFDFYTLLPEATIEVEVPPEEIAKPRATVSAPSERYVLQAGSFRQQEDAERRRAELLLLGLEPRVEETSGDNGRWYRVYLGPFDSRSKMAKARSLTANQDIDTLLLKRGAP